MTRFTEFIVEEAALDWLEALRDAPLRKLISGKLRVVWLLEAVLKLR